MKTAICFIVFGIFGLTALAEPICDCKKIVETKKCDNPDCIKICSLGNSLISINSHIIETCFGKDRGYTVSEKNIVADKALSLIEKSKADIMRMVEENKKLLQEKCPHCQQEYKISAQFGFEPKRKTCPERYLKAHHYKESKKMNLKKGVCNTDELLSYLESYATFLVTNSKKYLPKEISEDSRKLAKSLSQKLWADCPSKCSFLTSYVTTIDPEECKGEIDIKVNCTHKVETKWFKPVYNMDIDYEPELKCKESS